jgi:type IV pilus assembly protein PilX
MDARMNTTRSNTAMRQQRGAILVTSLLLLVVLTVLGVAMMRMTALQERMAGNARDVNVALQAAEAALREGEATLAPSVMVSRPVPQAAAGCVICQADFLPVAMQDTAQFNWSTAQEYGTAGTQDVAGVSEDPRYVISSIGFVPDSLNMGQNTSGNVVGGGRHFYQITARSTGASGQANVVLQTTFPRRF